MSHSKSSKKTMAAAAAVAEKPSRKVVTPDRSSSRKSSSRKSASRKSASRKSAAHLSTSSQQSVKRKRVKHLRYDARQPVSQKHDRKTELLQKIRTFLEDQGITVASTASAAAIVFMALSFANSYMNKTESADTTQGNANSADATQGNAKSADATQGNANGANKPSDAKNTSYTRSTHSQSHTRQQSNNSLSKTADSTAIESFLKMLVEYMTMQNVGILSVAGVGATFIVKKIIDYLHRPSFDATTKNPNVDLSKVEHFVKKSKKYLQFLKYKINGDYNYTLIIKCVNDDNDIIIIELKDYKNIPITSDLYVDLENLKVMTFDLELQENKQEKEKLSGLKSTRITEDVIESKLKDVNEEIKKIRTQEALTPKQISIESRVGNINSNMLVELATASNHTPRDLEKSFNISKDSINVFHNNLNAILNKLLESDSKYTLIFYCISGSESKFETKKFFL